jgi:hypothetical protein
MKKETNEGYYLLFFIFIGLLVFIYFYNQQQPQYLRPQAYPSQNSQNSQNSQQPNKKPIITNNNTMKNYTYNIENVDIHKDNLNNSDNNKLGCANSKYEPELEEIYGTTLRGNEYDPQIPPDEIYNYCIKPNKSDLPIVNPPLQLLLNNAPLRLSERHLI